MSTYNEMLQRIADEYFQTAGKDSATTKEIAMWAIQTMRWEPPIDVVLRMCREDFAKALREQYITNDYGQPVRAKHVARIKKDNVQQHLWTDIRTAKRQHMEIAFQQRRDQIVGDCRQLKRDVDFYNGRHNTARPIQTCFDFREDVEEGQYPTDYPDRRPEAEGDAA